MPLNVMLYRCFGGRNDDRDDDDDDGDGNDDNDNSDNGDANFVFIQQSLYIRVGSFPSHCLGNKTRVIKSQRALLNRLFSGRPRPTVAQNNQESRRKYWATYSSNRSFAYTAHSFAYSGLLASLALSTALTHSLSSS